MYPLLETIKVYKGLAQHLEWHQKRLNRSYHRLFGQKCPYNLAELVIVPSAYKNGLYKCRFLYGMNAMRLEFSLYEPRVITSLQLVKADGLDYSVKYTDRSSINDLLVLKGACDDILIVKDGLITDTSFTNVVFYDGRKWLTPGSPLLNGTARMRLISEGVIERAEVRVEDFGKFVSFRLINAMLEFHEQNDTPTTAIHPY